MDKKEESELILRAKEGDIPAFEKIIKQHKEKLYFFALSFTSGYEPDAEDILQHSLLKAYLHIDSFKLESSFSTWLWRIVKNEFINYKKSSKSRKYDNFENRSEEKLPDSVDIEEELIRKERIKNLLKVIDQLSVKYREIIVLVELQELSYEEAADVLGISISTLSSRVSRARIKLSKLIQKNMGLFL